MYVSVIQAQIDQMRDADQQPAQGHHHRMRHCVVVQRVVQHAGPQRDQARNQERQRTQRTVPPVTPDQAEQAQQGHEHHQRFFHTITEPERQTQRGGSGQQQRNHRAVHRAQHRTGGAEAIEQVAQT
uniref:Uncharacterized protein n=1 Tax=Knufia peltigerae TaxID=1002370 RepID=A0AA38XSR3_9EURO|nr:hypothetical protein H2204_012885 [Knufia peltigerae]